MHLIEPKTPTDLDHYYRLRFDELRKPWNQPEGSERASDDDSAIHALLLDENHKAAGVCRLSFATPEEGQLRFMAIRKDLQNKGLGKLLVDYLEDKARKQGAAFMTLQAREKAIPFYERLGYKVIEKTHLLFGEIQHFKMRKELNSADQPIS